MPKKTVIYKNLKQKKEKTVTLKDVENTVLSAVKKDKPKRVIPPEQKYVRRTADEFAAGAEPVRISGSHRLKQVALTLTPELHAASKAAAKEADVSFILWVRATLRKALRDGIDVNYELETPIETPEEPLSSLDPEA